MSVIIKGMEMPEGCRDCHMEMYYMNIGETRCRAINKTLADNYKAIPFDGRPDWCPLIEIPEGARLIDANKLEKNVLKWMPPDPCGVEEKEYPFETDICVSMLMEIDEAPTIFEEEEE